MLCVIVAGNALRTRSKRSFVLSWNNFHAAPKCYSICDRCCCWFWFWIVPNCIRIDLAITPKRIVACGTFPSAHRMCRTCDDILLVERASRKIGVAFNFGDVIALRNYHVVPNRFHDEPSAVRC